MEGIQARLPPRTPGEKRMVRTSLHDLFLQPLEGTFALAVDSRHIDAEDTHQAVRFVLHPSGLSPRGPSHSPCHGHGRQGHLECQDANVDFRDLPKKRCEDNLVPNPNPFLREKSHVDRRNELLESESPGEPFATPEGRVCTMRVSVGRNVGQVDVADCSVSVPLVHGVDRFGQFGAACLVDTARIYPNPAESLGCSVDAAAPDFRGRPCQWIKIEGISRKELADVLKGLLVVVPDMR